MKDTHVVIPFKDAPYPSATSPSSLPLLGSDEGVAYVVRPISKNQADSSRKAGGGPKPLGLTTCESHLSE